MIEGTDAIKIHTKVDLNMIDRKVHVVDSTNYGGNRLALDRMRRLFHWVVIYIIGQCTGTAFSCSHEIYTCII